MSSFGGNRAREFEMRLEGATYEEVARAGGGIVSTVKATRSATEEELAATGLAARRRPDMRKVSPHSRSSRVTVSIVETELRMLRTARKIGEYAASSCPHKLSSARMQFPRNSRIARIVISTTSACLRLSQRTPKVSSMLSTVFAKALPFRPNRSRTCFDKGGGARTSAQASCRTTLQSRWRSAGCFLWRLVGRPSGISRRERRESPFGKRVRRGSSARSLLHAARNAISAA